MDQRSIGAYIVLEKLGSGGMGDVFLAEDPRLRRKVAIKSIGATNLNDPEARKQLLREARLAARLNHPNIATIYDIVESGEQSHIVMEFVDGQSLANRLRTGALSVTEGLDIASQLVDAVAHAHAHGIIHRDIKPANIYLALGGRVKVLDFGIASGLDHAKHVTPSDDTTAPGAVLVGTPAYMSPEQLLQGALDVRTDIYSIGIVMFEILTGKRPYNELDMVSLAGAVIAGSVPSAREHVPAIPDNLDRIVRRCMAKKPYDRYASTNDLKSDIVRVKIGEPIRSSVANATAGTDAVPLEYTQARALMNRGDVPGNFDGALELLQRCIQKDRRFALAHAALGELHMNRYHETGDTTLAIRALESTVEALRLDPAQVTVRLTLGRIHASTGRTEEAIEEFRRVIAEQPNDVEAHRNLGEVLMRTGQTDESVAEFQKAIQLQPNDSTNFRMMGLCCYRAARYQEAVACFIRVTELQPDNAWAFQMLGTTYHALGRVGHALANYQKANMLTPMASAYSNIGTIHYAEGRYDEAMEAYERAIALKPSNPVHYRNLGDTLKKIGQAEKALERYKQAIERSREILKINPKDAITLSQLAVYEAKTGAMQDARQHAANAAALNSVDAEILYRKVVVSAISGDVSAAMNTLKVLVAQGYSRDVIARDEDLEAIRGLPEFNELFTA